MWASCDERANHKVTDKSIQKVISDFFFQEIVRIAQTSGRRNVKPSHHPIQFPHPYEKMDD